MNNIRFFRVFSAFIFLSLTIIALYEMNSYDKYKSLQEVPFDVQKNVSKTFLKSYEIEVSKEVLPKLIECFSQNNFINSEFSQKPLKGDRYLITMKLPDDYAFYLVAFAMGLEEGLQVQTDMSDFDIFQSLKKKENPDL